MNSSYQYLQFFIIYLLTSCNLGNESQLIKTCWECQSVTFFIKMICLLCVHKYKSDNFRKILTIGFHHKKVLDWEQLKRTLRNFENKKNKNFRKKSHAEVTHADIGNHQHWFLLNLKIWFNCRSFKKLNLPSLIQCLTHIFSFRERLWNFTSV